jgi:hypothetical protein
MSERVSALADRLVGTCYHGVDEIAELTKDECYQLDDLVFMCGECEWWFEQSECVNTDEGWFCRECGAKSSAKMTKAIRSRVPSNSSRARAIHHKMQRGDLLK